MSEIKIGWLAFWGLFDSGGPLQIVGVTLGLMAWLTLMKFLELLLVVAKDVYLATMTGSDL